jgi:hypothetical protein
VSLQPWEWPPGSRPWWPYRDILGTLMADPPRRRGWGFGRCGGTFSEPLSVIDSFVLPALNPEQDAQRQQYESSLMRHELTLVAPPVPRVVVVLADGETVPTVPPESWAVVAALRNRAASRWNFQAFWPRRMGSGDLVRWYLTIVHGTPEEREAAFVTGELRKKPWL